MATDFDISQAAANVYATSVLELAEQAGQADTVADELAQIRALWSRETAFAALMSSAGIDNDTRGESIKRIFGGRVSKLVFNLLMVLNAKRRAMILPAVCDTFRRMLNEQRGRRETFVTSAVPLDDAQRSHLRTEVKRLVDWDPIFVERVDPNLLGGLTVQVGDRVYDASVRRRLADMRHDLLESSQRQLAAGASKFMTEG